MSNPKASNLEASNSKAFRADSLALGVSIMLVLTIVQRAIGFGRGIWFCQLLDDATLGQWAMGFGFVTLVTPVFLFGLPGSLPRFVETYLRQGQLRTFLARLLGATGLVVGIGITLLVLFPAKIASFVFNDAGQPTLVFSLAFAAIGVIIFNVTNEIVAGLRLVRVSSISQFCQSVLFTLLGVAWLACGGGLAGLLVAFGMASLLGAIPAWWCLARGWDAVERADQPLDAGSMWRRLLPYAASIWLMNLLGNTFELSDRYMLLHWAPGDGLTGQRSVGQYHSAMIIPALMLSVAGMVSSVLLPYLSSDWEQQRRAAVVARLREALMATSLIFTTGAASALLLAPILYGGFLNGVYDSGLSVLPICLVYCIWSALAVIAQTYLFVAERGRWVATALAIGLGANCLLNGILVPRWGLSGAVCGTMLANLVVLCGIWWSGSKFGLPLDRATLWMTLLPASLLAGGGWALGFVLLIALSSPELRRYLTELWRLAGCQFGVLAR